MKKKFILMGMILFILAAQVFSAGAKDADSSSQKKRIFGFTCMDQTNPFQITMKNAIESVVKSRGDTLISIDGMNDQTKQNNAIEDMITRGIVLLFLNPVDKNGVKPALESCKRAGVKVIVVDSGVADPQFTESFISSNNYQAGKICGEEMKKILRKNAKIALIDNPLAESVVSRMKGLEDALAGSGITIVEQAHYSSMNAVLPTFEDFLQAHPDLDAFWGLNDDFGLIAQGVVESAGMQKQMKVFSVDGSPSAKKSIQQKKLYSTAAQSPATIGKKAAEVAYDVLAGKKVEKTYSIDTVAINQQNITSFDVNNWQ